MFSSLKRISVTGLDKPAPRSGALVLSIPTLDAALIYGGSNGVNAVLDDGWLLYCSERKWVRLSTGPGFPPPLTTATAVYVNENSDRESTWLIMGGSNRTGNALLTFKSLERRIEWRYLSERHQGPGIRQGFVLLQLKGLLYLHGGMDLATREVKGDLWRGDIQGQEILWTLLESMAPPGPLADHSAGVVQGCIVIASVGGREAWRYDGDWHRLILDKNPVCRGFIFGVWKSLRHASSEGGVQMLRGDGSGLQPTQPLVGGGCFLRGGELWTMFGFSGTTWTRIVTVANLDFDRVDEPRWDFALKLPNGRRILTHTIFIQRKFPTIGPSESKVPIEIAECLVDYLVKVHRLCGYLPPTIF